MDRQIPISTFTKYQRWFWVTGALVLFAVVYLVGQSFTNSTYRADANKIEIATVEQGDFEEYIALTGTVEPLKTVMVVALEGGVVKEKHVEDGAEVTLNAPLFKLDNQDLQLEFMSRETALLDQLNNLRNTQINLENTGFNYKQQLLELEKDLSQAALRWKADQNLYADSLISFQEYETSRSNFISLQKRFSLLEQTSNNHHTFKNTQASHYQFSSSLILKSLETLRSSLEMLEVRAPASGLLTGLNIELGESIQKGQKVAEVDLKKGYRLHALVDEIYISRIKSGLKAQIEFGGKIYQLLTEKIYPQVSNGQFRVDLLFDGHAPTALKYGQSLQIRLSLGDPAPSLLLKRGGFYQKTGGSWVYVLEGNKALKRSTSFGRQNPDFLEITDGLQQGDRVIISSYTIFGDADIIELNSPSK